MAVCSTQTWAAGLANLPTTGQRLPFACFGQDARHDLGHAGRGLGEQIVCAGQALALRRGAPPSRAWKRKPGMLGVVSQFDEGGGGPASETVLVRSGSNSMRVLGLLPELARCRRRARAV